MLIKAECETVIFSDSIYDCWNKTISTFFTADSSTECIVLVTLL